MSKLSQLNALRRDTTAQAQSQLAAPAVPGNATPDWNRTQPRAAKPWVNPFSEHSRARGRMWEENFTAATQRMYDIARELDDHRTAAAAASAKNKATCEALEGDASVQSRVAQSIAKQNQHATALAMHNGKSLTAYASGLIRFVDEWEGIDEELGDYFKSAVRRLFKGAIADWESAALGTDFDPSTIGGVG